MASFDFFEFLDKLIFHADEALNKVKEIIFFVNIFQKIIAFGEGIVTNHKLFISFGVGP
jgi:hypothetical protein